MGASRALGGLICIICVVIAAVHIYFGYIKGSWGPGALAFALPITAGVLVVTGLGFWLGWIMATTKEAAPVTPSPPPAEEPSEELKVPTEEVKVERKTEGKIEEKSEEGKPSEEPEEKS